MPPKKIKQRKKWDPQAMIKAVTAVKYKGMGYMKASKTFSVPKTTLEGYCKKNGPLEDLIQTKLGRKPVFSTDLENQLVSYCLEMEERYYGLTSQDVRHLAFNLALRNNVSSPFSKTRASAGRKWLASFKERHPKIAFRKPQDTSSFTPENAQKFYKILETGLTKINYNPSRIYNVDATAVTTVRHKTTEVIGLKCQKEIDALPKAARQSLVTVITCMNAAGDYIPPALIFQQKHVDNFQTGALLLYHPSGWIQTNLFVQWMDHFVKHTKPTKSDPVVLVLEGHNSYIRNQEVIDKVRECHISNVCLPPQSSHKLHPIEMSFMEDFQRHYSEGVNKWLIDHAQKAITSNHQILRIVDQAHSKTATVETAMNGFSKCGIHPFDTTFLKDEDFTEVLGKGSIETDNADTINDYETPILSGALIKQEEILSEPGSSGMTFTKIKTEAELSPSDVFFQCSHVDNDQVSSEGDDDECFFCSGLLFVDKNNERWIKCNVCYKWYHGECVGRKENENYICEFCCTNIL